MPTKQHPPLSFRTDKGERAEIERQAAAEGVSVSRFLRDSVRDRLAERPRDVALLDALRSTGATLWVDVKRARGDRPPSARIVAVKPPGAESIDGLATLAAVPVEGKRFALVLDGAGDYAGAKVVLAVLPERTSATLEIPLAGLGDNLLAVP